MCTLKSFITGLICGAITIAGALISLPAEAAVITVDSTDQEANGLNNGNCTLGEAISAAVVNSKIDACPAGEAMGNVIQLAHNATYVLTAVYTHGSGFQNSESNGLPRLSGKITIEGNGATIQRDVNAPEFRIFEIFNTKDGGVITLKDLTIQNGKHTASVGAGISSGNSDLILENVKLVNNTSTLAGTALSVEYGAAAAYPQLFPSLQFSVSINNSVVQGNSVTDTSKPGVYYVISIGDAKTITFTKNTVKQNTGGGAYISKGAVTIQDCIFSQNTIQGALFIKAAPGKVVGSSFIANEGPGEGAINNTGTLSIEDSYFKGNKATTGSAGAVGNSTPTGIMTIVNSTFAENTAGGNGGAIASNYGKSLSIINSTIANNTAKNGGAIFFDTTNTAGTDTVTLTNSILFNNSPNNCAVNAMAILTSGGFNIFQASDGCPKVAGDIVVKPTDIVLSNLVDGNIPGFGFFYLPSNSLAVNAGTKCATCPAKDQRGATRDAKYDIGSVEANCADGFVHEILGEQCDDGNNFANDGCVSCQVEIGYSCSGNPSVCQKTCGNGVVDGAEQCDDSNIASGDGCSTTCTIEDGYGCFGAPSQCVQSCGNGQKDGGTEECDDSNKLSGDGCSSKCQIEAGYACSGLPSVCKGSCGNGTIEVGEKCDDANKLDNDGCSSGCLVELYYSCSGTPSLCLAICGDGKIIDGAEGCDDGNKTDGDGCSSACKSEKQYICYGEPSVCNPACGDSLIMGKEECDDGNWDNGDGCNKDCKKEGCGDGIAQTALKEQCDKTDLDKKDCLSVGLGFDGGTLSCNADCSFNTTACTATPKESCGDGKKNGTELCDKDDLGGKSCTSLGLDFESGKITCNPDCTINTSECVKPKIAVVETKPVEQPSGPTNGGIVPAGGTEGGASGKPGTGTEGSTSGGPGPGTTSAPADAAPAGSGGGCSLIR